MKNLKQLANILLIVSVLCIVISIFLSGPLRAFLSLFGAVLAVIAAFIIMRRSRS
jgi:uncharacterized membrane protein